MATLTTNSPVAHTGASWFETRLDAWKEARALRKRFRQTVAELQTLSDRELADLGLHRSNIRSVAMKALADG